MEDAVIKVGSERIQIGTYVVVQRQSFVKLLKLSDLQVTVQLGRDTVELKNIVDKPFLTTFKMQLKEGSGKKNRRIYTLEPCENVGDWKEILKSIESGTDNRNINDDGQVSEKFKRKQYLQQ